MSNDKIIYNMPVQRTAIIKWVLSRKITKGRVELYEDGQLVKCTRLEREERCQKIADDWNNTPESIERRK